MKKYLWISWIFLFAFCTFYGNINVSSYDLVNPGNKIDVSKIKDEIYYIVDEYYKQYGNDSSSTVIGSYAGSLCPNGINVDVYRKEGKKEVFDHNETMDFEKYVAGVVAAENAWSEGGNIESMKAQAVAARSYAYVGSNQCKNTVKGNQTFQAYTDPTNNSLALRAAEETKGLIINYNGRPLRSEYDAFCVSSYNSANASYTLRQKEQVIPKSFVDSDGTFCKGTKSPESCGCNGHGRGMSQIGARYLQRQGYTYEQILTYYYPVGIELIRASLPYANWSQRDPAWADDRLGTSAGTEMKNIGCLVTAYAITIAKEGAQANVEGEFSPKTFLAALKAKGIITQSGDHEGSLHMDSIGAVVPGYQWKGSESGFDINRIKNLMSDGYSVIISVPMGNRTWGHYVAVDRIEGNQVYILDPAKNPNGNENSILLSQRYSRVTGILVFKLK